MALADRVLTERRQLAITAARLSPPPYIKAELGKRPRDPAKCKAWDRGVTDRAKPFGPEAKNLGRSSGIGR